MKVKVQVMTIGEALRRKRKQLGLSQTEMASNVISTAFYSKVERDEYDLDTMKLIKMLMIHQIDPIEFMKEIIPKKKDDDLYSHDDLHRRILEAFADQDLKRIKAIQNYCEMHKIEDLYDQTVFLEAALKKDLKIILDEMKEKVKNSLFQKENWNDDYLFTLTNSLAAFDIETSSELVHKALKKYSKKEQLTKNIVYLLSSICVNYLSLVYFNHSRTAVRDEAISFLQALPEQPENCFAKIMANYYEAMFNNDQLKINSILTFMEKNNLKKLAKRNY